MTSEIDLGGYLVRAKYGIQKFVMRDKKERKRMKRIKRGSIKGVKRGK